MDMIMRGRIFLRSLFLQSCWNFERMQNLGLAYCLEPWLSKIYSGRPQELRGSIGRHQEFFNTQPYVASLIIGMIGSMEEQAAQLPEQEKAQRLERIKTVKAAAAAALAGLGDVFFWGRLSPFCAAAALAATLAVWPAPISIPLGMAVYLAVYNAFSLGVRWIGLGMGYRWGEKIALKIKELPIQAAMVYLRVSGGALALVACAVASTMIPGGNWRLMTAAAVVFLALKIAGVGSYQLYGGSCLAGILASAAGWI